MSESIINIRVRKMKASKNSFRFRYAHQGKDALAIGDYTIKDLEAMNKIVFSFTESITEEEKQKILTKWQHKL